jgi:hypothetical protein
MTASSSRILAELVDMRPALSLEVLDTVDAEVSSSSSSDVAENGISLESEVSER